MVNVVYDKREWRIQLNMDNSECPHLFYPANLHGCEISKNREGECKLELCPYRVCNIISKGNKGGVS